MPLFFSQLRDAAFAYILLRVKNEWRTSWFWRYQIALEDSRTFASEQETLMQKRL